MCALWQSDALSLLTRASDFETAVSDRFQLLHALGFWPLVGIKAALVTLSIFSFIRAVATKDATWIGISTANLLAMSAILILLNMKWPLILFYSLHLMAILLFAERPMIPSIAFATLTVAGYLLISLALLRAVPMISHEATPAIQTATQQPSLSAGEMAAVPTTTPAARPPLPFPAPKERAASTLSSSSSPASAPSVQQGSLSVTPVPAIESQKAPLSETTKLMFATILNRMAQPFPYYYETFTRSPGECGSIVDRLERKPSRCHPSNLVYAEMFADRFAGVGTAPQAVHVTGYALGGWVGAIVELVAASVILGLYASISVLRGPLADTAAVIGAMTGYFFSQLPVEGPIVYDHGILWCGVLLAVLAIVGAASTRISDLRRTPSRSVQ
jgi:hypothetical protein